MSKAVDFNSLIRKLGAEVSRISDDEKAIIIILKARHDREGIETFIKLFWPNAEIMTESKYQMTFLLNEKEGEEDSEE